jgi:hypothetical protein
VTSQRTKTAITIPKRLADISPNLRPTPGSTQHRGGCRPHIPPARVNLDRRERARGVTATE